MKKVYYMFFVLFCIKANTAFSQDKLFLRNGTSLHCKIVSVNEHTISYRDTLEASPITTIAKTQIILAEIKGEVYVFGSDKKVNEQSGSTNETWQQRQDRKMQDWKISEDTLSNNILGFYLPVILFGRLGVSYERLFVGKSIGIKIPFILSYNPLAYLPTTNSSNSGTTNTTNLLNKGIGFITGIDVNFYHDIKPQMKYYFGPRIRYGTDMFLGGIEGLTAQIQNGIFRSSGKRFTNTFGVGFGFFKLSKKYSNLSGYTENQVYPSYSITWRLGFRL
jgi:hypothetical protein